MQKSRVNYTGQKMKDAIDTIHTLISHGEIFEALNYLDEKKEFFGAHKKEVILLFQQASTWRQIHISGQYSTSDYTTEKSKISTRILELIALIESQGSKPVGTVTEDAPIPKRYMSDLIWSRYFPTLATETIPFGEMLDVLFFQTTKDTRYPIHGPNVIRFTLALLNFRGTEQEPGLFSDEEYSEAEAIYKNHYQKIQDSLFEIHDENRKHIDHKKQSLKEKTTKDLLITAALYHDIGKYIKNHKHPEIGSNIIRHYDPESRQKLISLLGHPEDDKPEEKKQHRFALLTSVVKHHDKFGVISTGEGSLPLLSDILYFDSNPKNKEGIIKNVTAVMILNLADIAAVNRATQIDRDRVTDCIKNINKYRANNGTESDIDLEIDKIKKVLTNPKSCLGLSVRKLDNILEDWENLLETIKHVEYDKLDLKNELLREAKMPYRTIERVFRLIIESLETSNAKCLSSIDIISKSIVETILIGKLGIYQFQAFCDSFAIVVKLDYGLKFFKSLVCATIRKKICEKEKVDIIAKHNDVFKKDGLNNRLIGAEELLPQESEILSGFSVPEKEELAYEIADLMVKVLEVLVSRYNGVFTTTASSPRRYGLQMGELTNDAEIWKRIISQLCIEKKEHFAFAWIIDEVTIWSFD